MKEAKPKSSECLCLKRPVMESEVLKTPISHRPPFQRPHSTTEHSQTSSRLTGLNHLAGVFCDKLDSSSNYKPQFYYGVFVNLIVEPIFMRAIDLMPAATECKFDHPIIIKSTSISPVEIKSTITAYCHASSEHVGRDVSGCSTPLSDIISSLTVKAAKQCILIEPIETGTCVARGPVVSVCFQTDIALKTPSTEEENQSS
ncbi:hypothetical protein P879_07199 [Paragonimus westermani]|uniref:Uncharacterized protein n=1 Tax=Paragonimus westermani TaxID=34504 RepID=A0A8T0DL45_9TREM|nr:hypothetical protein P879_07199 [Paragonimus westermani]